MLICSERGDPREEDESAIRRAELDAANAAALNNVELAKRARLRLERLRERRYLYPHGCMFPLLFTYDDVHVGCEDKND